MNILKYIIISLSYIHPKSSHVLFLYIFRRMCQLASILDLILPRLYDEIISFSLIFIIMERKFKQGWSSIPAISTKRTIISHLTELWIGTDMSLGSVPLFHDQANSYYIRFTRILMSKCKTFSGWIIVLLYNEHEKQFAVTGKHENYSHLH